MGHGPHPCGPRTTPPRAGWGTGGVARGAEPLTVVIDFDTRCSEHGEVHCATMVSSRRRCFALAEGMPMGGRRPASQSRHTLGPVCSDQRRRQGGERRETSGRWPKGMSPVPMPMTLGGCLLLLPSTVHALQAVRARYRWPALRCTALYCTALHLTALYCTSL